MIHSVKPIFTATLLAWLSLSPQLSLAQTATYSNPVIDISAPDPTVIRAEDGTFYLYATEDTRNVPIYQSVNLVDWKQVGTAANTIYTILNRYGVGNGTLASALP